MKFSKALEELEAGKKIRRSGWSKDCYVENGHCQGGNGRAYMTTKHNFFHASCEELMADDWELVEEDLDKMKNVLIDMVKNPPDTITLSHNGVIINTYKKQR